jgi:hypothetical protein
MLVQHIVDAAALVWQMDCSPAVLVNDGQSLTKHGQTWIIRL